MAGLYRQTDWKGPFRILLADAHLTAIRKLLLPVLTYTLFAPPGPPLPPNHPSAPLQAKLYLHVHQLYSSARALLSVHQQPASSAPSNSSRKLFRTNTDKDVVEPEAVEGEIIPELKRYLAKEAQLALALAHKWLGIDAGENGKGTKVGEALAWVKDAQGRLEDLEDSKMRAKLKGLSLGKSRERKKEERRARMGRVERELEVVKAWVKAYQKMNDTVGVLGASTTDSSLSFFRLLSNQYRPYHLWLPHQADQFLAPKRSSPLQANSHPAALGI